MKTKSTNYMEMLFENRNKEYGAYELRVHYEKRLILSFGMALLISCFFFLVPCFLTQMLTRKQIAGSVDRQVIYDFSKEYVIERPQKPVTPAFKKSINHSTTYRIVKKEDEMIEEPIKNTDPFSSLPANGTGIATDSANATWDKDVDIGPVPSAPMSSASVDVQPVFPGGQEAMMKFLMKNLRYPSVALENGIAGQIFVSFVIDEQGNTTSIYILKGLGYGMDEEVKRVIRLMPKWSPGTYKNQVVQTAFIMPVSFTLK